MKNRFVFLLVLAGLLFSQCSKDKPEEATPAIDYDQASINLMAKVKPQLIGVWDLRQVHVKYQPYNQGQKRLRLIQDTVFQNLATLTVQAAAVPRTAPPDPRHPDFEGTLAYRGRTYPIRFSLLANSEHIYKGSGPQAHFLFEYNFPNGTRIPEPEEVFLDDLGLLDNFALELIDGQPRMIWYGLNRGVERIELRKR